MTELWDVYDENKNKTGKLVERENYKFQKGEYHLITVAVIMNSKKQILIAKRSEKKKRAPLKWEFSGGGVRAGENSLQAILRELKEEIGLEFSAKEAIFLKDIRKDEENGSGSFKDFWLFKTDIKAENITFPDNEATEAKWVTIDELLEMVENEKIISGLDFVRKDFELAIEKSQYSKKA